MTQAAPIFYPGKNGGWIWLLFFRHLPRCINTRVLCRLVFALLPSLVGLIGCASLRASPAPASAFLTHPEMLSADDKHLPWNSTWRKDGDKILEFSTQYRKIFIEPVNTDFLNSSLVIGNPVAPLDGKDIKEVVDLLTESFATAIRKTPETNLTVVDSRKDADLVLSLALVELIPTKTAVNTVANLGALVVPGSKAVQGTVAVGGQSAGGAYAAGTIAIEFKIYNVKKKQIVAEVKDRQSDPASILPNYRDFQQFGWARNTVRAWAEMFVNAFSTPSEAQPSSAKSISVVPW